MGVRSSLLGSKDSRQNRAPGRSSPSKVTSEFASSWRGAAGVGLAIGTQFGRVEVNYNLWQRQQDYDQVAPGLQWGVGIDFL